MILSYSIPKARSAAASTARRVQHLRCWSSSSSQANGFSISAVAAAFLRLQHGAARAIGIEVDPEANAVATRNAERNGVMGRVQFLDGDAGVLAPLVGPAEVILSNILRTANTALLPTISEALAPNGVAIFSGMERDEAPEFRQALETAGFRPIQETVDAGWWGVAAGRLGKMEKTGKTGKLLVP
jgi:ribosomal protein L11 methylase PrmA